MPRRRRRSAVAARRAPPGRWLLRGLLLALIGFAVLAAWILWLDQRVVSGFEGRRWSLPGVVYAQPLELHPGKLLGANALAAALQRVGYSLDANATQPGSFRQRPDATLITTRRFRYWDGVEPQQQVRVRFAGGAIAALEQLPSGAPLGLLRIEPRVIGKIYPEHDEDRVLVTLEQVPRELVAALLAVEDRNFFRHAGLDWRGILRAAWANLRAAAVVQGGSTLTQQLVKNFWLSSERTFARKINEMVMALLLERRYDKAQILGTYINEVYLGQHGARGIHGFGTAARFYFGRPLEELRVDQLALLAGLVRGASYYNPRAHPQRARERRDLVLALMAEQGLLDGTLARQARSRPLDVHRTPAWSQAEFPEFLDLVRRQLLRDYPLPQLRNAGLQIFTTLDASIQEQAQAALSSTLVALERERRDAVRLEGAVIVIDSGSGELLAAVGGRRPAAAGFNRSIDARRPIGSLVKPFVFLAALQQPERYSVLSLFDDTPLQLDTPAGPWRPANYDREFHGRVTLQEALVHSYNLATVRLGLEVGLPRVIEVLRAAGIERPLEPLPSMLLGALELSPFEAAQAYQPLAGGGFLSPLNGIREVLDRDGRGLRRYPLEVRRAFDPRATFILDRLLTEVTRSGTGRALAGWLPGAMPVAGKTGTTNDLRDSWFAGFGDRMLAVVWVGRDDNRPTGLSGASGAMRVWSELARRTNMRPLSQHVPPGIGWHTPAPLRYRGACRNWVPVPFIEPHAPRVEPDCIANSVEFGQH